MSSQNIYKISPIKSKNDVEKMLKDCIQELGVLMPGSPYGKSPKGLFKYLDTYWDKDNKNPLFLIINDQIIGYAVITVLGKESFELEDYYIEPEFRTENNSLNMVNYLYENYKGKWELLTGKHKDNIRAIKFWEKFAKGFKKVEFKESERSYFWTLSEKKQ